MATHARSPRLGYALAATAAALWALNGSLARFLLDDHLPAARLAELRSVCTCVALVGALAIVRPRLLRIDPRDAGRFVLLGVVGLGGVSAFYFAAVGRLDVGVALTIQYLGPLVLLVWLKLVYGRRLPRGLWAAAGLCLVGCCLVVKAYDPGALDGIGIAEAFGATATFAMYLFASERLGQRYEAPTTVAWGFGMASVFWLITQPIWTFPTSALATPRDLAFAAYVVFGGTLIPFACMIAATRHLPAARAGVVGTLEPVLGAALAWPIHDQVLSPVQIAGGLIAIGAIVWVQTQRLEPDAELAPAYRSRPPRARPVE